MKKICKFVSEIIIIFVLIYMYINTLWLPEIRKYPTFRYL